MLKKTSDIGGKGDHVSLSNNIVSKCNASEVESENKESKGWKAIRIRDPKRLRNQQREPHSEALEKGIERYKDHKGWKAIRMTDSKSKRDKTESTTSPTDESHHNRQNRKRRIRRQRIKRKRRKGRKKPKRKRRQNNKGCRKKVRVKGKKICLKRRCTVAWCQNRNSRPPQQTSEHKYNFWGQDVTPI